MNLKKLRRFRVFTVVAVFLVHLLPAPLFAAVIQWDSPDGEWSINTNWNPTNLPGSSDAPVVGNGGIARISDGSAFDVDFASIGANGTDDGDLIITNGSLTANEVSIGGSGDTGTVTLDGTSASFTVDLSSASIGSTAQGFLNVRNGAAFNQTSGAGLFFRIGGTAAAAGTVLVEDDGSSVTTSSRGLIGSFGSGTLTVADGGLARFANSANGVLIGSAAGSSGQLNITGTAGSRGVVEAHYFRGGDGTHTIDFDGGIFRALGLQNDLFRDFSAGEITLDAGGGFFDTNGHYVETDADIDGAGGLTKQGANFLVLKGNNTYTGVTRVDNGTLRISSGGDITQTSNILVASDGVNDATLNIRGVGSTVTTTGLLEVGADTGTGTLDIEDGGVVNSDAGRLATITTAMGNATVTGPGSQWNITNALTVGSNGDATLDIENGGRVSNTDAIVGRFATSTSSVTVTGTGSEWINSNSLTLGSDGDGTVTAAAGEWSTSRTVQGSSIWPSLEVPPAPSTSAPAEPPVSSMPPRSTASLAPPLSISITPIVITSSPPTELRAEPMC